MQIKRNLIMKFFRLKDRLRHLDLKLAVAVFKNKIPSNDCVGLAPVFDAVSSALLPRKMLKILFKSISANSLKCSLV